MGDGIAVNTEQVRAHAKNIRQLQGKVAAAQAAAAQANFTSTMFGTIGARLVWPLMAPLGALGEESMEMTDGLFGSTADAVDKLADEFETVDTAVMLGWNKATEVVEDVWGWATGGRS